MIDIEIRFAEHGFVVHVAGELDIDTAPEFQRAVDAVFRDNARWQALILDLAELTYLDAHGASVLVHARHLARRTNTELVIKNLQTEPAALLATAGFGRIVAEAQHHGARETSPPARPHRWRQPFTLGTSSARRD